jgi:uncharacterized protein (TIGR03435 family)
MISVLSHVWQSTVFAVVAGLLTVALKNNQARTRYWLWLAASLKFLVPFALFVSIGGHIHWRTGPSIPTLFAVEQVSRALPGPSATTLRRHADQPASENTLPAILFSVWLCGFTTVAVFYGRRWRRVSLAQRQSSALDLPAPIQILSSPALFEPAVFGILRPVLLLPEGITERLTHEQLMAILTHELCHVRRRDNLAAALHMVVEAIFWFHPLVWWLGARLVDEREQACDESVLQSGNDPEVYAESILEVCKLYLASPLTCAAGVSGANLSRRIEAILAARVLCKLSRGKKLLLAGTGTLALAAPMLVGLANAPLKVDPSAYSFNSISIKPSIAGSRSFEDEEPPKFVLNNKPLRNLIRIAYTLHDFQISGGPAWMNSDGFDITAKTKGLRPFDQMKPLRALLEDRFRLKFHRETRELPVYVLTVAKTGLKLRRTKEGSCVVFYPQPRMLRGQLANYCTYSKPRVNMLLNHVLDATGISIEGIPDRMVGLAPVLSSELKRQGIDELVIDKTGLTGLFDFHLEWNDAKSSDPDRPTFLVALRQQLGLNLEPARGPVEILVIDHAEKPAK